MFKEKIKKIRNVTNIITLSDIKAITNEKNITDKSNYTKWIFRLKRGLYSLDKNITSLKVANTLITPSYISLETVLSFYSIIPDGVVSYTSITKKQTNSYKNKFGSFYYSHIKEKLYFWYNLKDWIFIADKEKALLDYFYLRSSPLKLSVYDYINIDKNKYSSIWCKKSMEWFQEERFENLDILDYKLLKKYSKQFNKKVYYMTILLIHYYKKHEQKFQKIIL